MKKSNKQHFIDLGSKQKSLERDEKARIDQWVGQSKAWEHINHNHALEEWDHTIHPRHRTPEGVDSTHHRSDHPQPLHSGKKGLK
jgi:hypothetical protein